MAVMLRRQSTIKSRYAVDYSAPLGRGGFSDVYLGHEISSKTGVAVKLVVPNPSYANSDKYIQNELSIIRKTSHPNLVRLLDDQKIDNTTYIILELCNKNLNDFAQEEREGLARPLKWQFIKEIVFAIEYLHSENIIHRDLKPENILVKIEGDTNTLKVSDFGLSKMVDGESLLTNTAGVGTEGWMAPEIVTDTEHPVRRLRYGIASDCFAVGMNINAVLKHSPGQPLTSIKGPHGQAYGLYILKLMMKKQAVPKPNLELPEDWMVLQRLILGLLKSKSENRWKIGQAKATIEEMAAEESRSDTAVGGEAPTDQKMAAEESRSDTAVGGEAPTDQSRRCMPYIKQRLARRGDLNGYFTAGMSERGHVVIADRRDQHVSLLHGPRCQKAALIELPDEVDYKCFKAVDANDRVLVQDGYDADTICLDRRGREIYRIKSSGELLTCMGDILCYVERKAGTDNWRIRLQRGADGVPIYPRPPGRLLSACRNNDGTYYVTEHHSGSLDIFTTAGPHNLTVRHIGRKRLSYQPIDPNGIAATSSGHVLIAEYLSADINIHDKTGRRVGKFTQQEMQLNEECILGISYCREDETLTVLAGDVYGTIHSVQTLRIGYLYYK